MLKGTEDLRKQYERKGYPQPIPAYLSMRFTSWDTTFASYNFRPLYEERGHGFEEVFKRQQDLGRYFYAWTVGRRLDLKPGHALEISSCEQVQALALWLVGLQGMTHRVLKDS